MKQFLLSIVAATSLMVVASGNLTAQTTSQWGIGLAYGSDTHVGFDGRLFLPVGSMRDLAIVPSLDVFLPDNGSFFTLDGNVNYTFLRFGHGGGLYGLAGLDLGISKATGFNSITRLGLNLGGGVRGDTGPMKLFGELKFVLGDFDQVVLYGGFYFDL